MAGDEQPKQWLCLSAALRYRLAAMTIRTKALWRGIRRLSVWLESDALPAAAEAGRDTACFHIRPEGRVELTGMPHNTPEVQLDDCKPMCDFLRGIGIERLHLDPRLESNQVSDILTLLYSVRKRLADRAGMPDNSPCTRLCEPGVGFACTHTQVDGDTLRVAYSYCMTRFSRIVQWLERRHQAFADHRALFHVAPIYAALGAAVVLAVFLLYTFVQNWWIMLGASVLAAVGLGAMVYLFFMIVGSVEYDNEERTYRLQLAHDQLKRYTDRIRADLAAARDVQEKLMPDWDRMPLPDRVEWAGSFVPEFDVGGDYFDVAELDDGQVAVLFADVCGHGMSAALITAILKTTFETWVDDRAPPACFAGQANRNLYRFTPDESFAAVIAAVYDSATGVLTYVNCGHAPEPILLPGDADLPVRGLTGAGAMLLGVLEEIEITESQVRLAKGDKVLFATDGLTEAMRTDSTMYGRDRFDEFLAAHRNAPLDELIDGLIGDVKTFVEGAEATDDRTALAFRVLDLQE